MAAPILRWIGGKRAQAKALAKEFFEVLTLTGGRFVEPFMGSASIALALAELGYPADQMRLSDGLDSLIELYHALQIYPKETIEAFADLGEEAKRARPKRLYAELRAELNSARRQQSLIPRPRIGVLFLYLNAAGFNGVIRENKRGDFNNARGETGQKLPSKGAILDFARAIRGASIRRRDFEGAISEAREGDLVYCDPPYDGTFTSYSTDWRPSDQERLAKALKDATRRGVWIYASNASTERIRGLYGSFCEVRERAIDWQVGGTKERRKKATELLLIGRPRTAAQLAFQP